MLLALDIGNSDITLGYWDGGAWQHIWRIQSDKKRPELFYGVRIRDHFFESDVKLENVTKVAISSVVPELTDRVVSVCKSLFNVTPIVLGPELYKKLPVGVLNPYEIGSDLVSNAP